MDHLSFQVIPKNLWVIFLCACLCHSPLFAKDTSTAKEDSLGKQNQARIYREEGLEQQNLGNLDAAMSLYQKAIELDPTFAVAYNDLGIVYEAKGSVRQAEESYLKAIKIDSNYLSAYSNLALLYENQRNLEKASFYWAKRAELGSPDDPWTLKAKQRLEDISLITGGRAIESSREQEVIGLIKDVTEEKSILRQDNKALAKKYLEEAKQSYDKEDYATAIKKAASAQQLDPTNREIEEFIEKVQIRALSR